jgi:hypothetical protein
MNGPRASGDAGIKSTRDLVRACSSLLRLTGRPLDGQWTARATGSTSSCIPDPCVADLLADDCRASTDGGQALGAENALRASYWCLGRRLAHRERRASAQPGRESSCGQPSLQHVFGTRRVRARGERSLDARAEWAWPRSQKRRSSATALAQRERRITRVFRCVDRGRGTRPVRAARLAGAGSQADNRDFPVGLRRVPAEARYGRR